VATSLTDLRVVKSLSTRLKVGFVATPERISIEAIAVVNVVELDLGCRESKVSDRRRSVTRAQ